jgi:predicted transcriptional regulator
MTQAGLFKGIALSEMKKEFSPHDRPFLILDQDGAVVKKFGVTKDKTVVLIYDQKGKLRDVEENLGNQSAETNRIVAIAKQLQGD